jgi:hypothetical protein
MTTLTNQTGSKAVNIKSNMSSFIAMYVQIYNGEQQALESKCFATEKKAIKWSETKLNN